MNAGHLKQSQVGFVTFRTIAQASQRSQLVMDHRADVMQPVHAPDPVSPPCLHSVIAN
jgi:hypothetical protein